MKRQFAVIGLGRFGYRVAKTLAEMGAEVAAIDSDPERVEKVSDFVTLAYQMDATDEKALRSVGMQNVDVAVVSIGENIEASILVVMTLKEMGVKEIIAKGVTTIHGKVLEHIGVSKVVYPEAEMAVRLAHSLTTPNVMEQLTLSEDYSIEEISPPKSLIGKTLVETELRKKFGVTVMAIRRKVPGLDEKGESTIKEEWIVSPPPTSVITNMDELVIIGKNEDLKKVVSME